MATRIDLAQLQKLLGGDGQLVEVLPPAVRVRAGGRQR
jgi:hypothetical protein